MSPHEARSKQTGERSAFRERNLLLRRDRWGNPLALWVACGLLSLLPLIGVSPFRLRMENTLRQWLPAGDSRMHAVDWFEQEFGADNALLISWEGSSWDDPRIAFLASALRREIPGQHSGVVDVITPHELAAQMEARGISPADARARLAGVLVGSNEKQGAALRLQIDERVASGDEILAWVRQSAELAFIPAEELHLAGSLPLRTSLAESLGRSNWHASPKHQLLYKLAQLSPLVLCLLAVSLLTVVLVNNFRLACLLLLMAGMSGGTTLALVAASGAQLGLALLVLPLLIGGLTLVGALSIAGAWTRAVSENPETAFLETMRTAGRPSAMAAVVMGVGSVCLFTSPYGAVSNLALPAVCGFLISLAILWGGLPALLWLWPPRHFPICAADRAPWGNAGSWMARHPRSIIWSGALLTVVLASGLTSLRFETTPIGSFPEDSAIVADHKFIENNVGGSVPVDLVLAFGPDARNHLTMEQRLELVRKIEAKISHIESVTGTLSLADFAKELPESATDADRAGIKNLEAQLESGDPLLRSLTHVSWIPLYVQDRAGELQVFPQTEVWRITAYASAMAPQAYGAVLDEILNCANDEIRSRPQVQAFTPGAVPLFLRTQETITPTLGGMLLAGLVLVQLALTVVLRGLRIGGLAMLPTLAATFLVFGGLGWSEAMLNAGSLAAFPVALGISLLCTLVLLASFEDGLRRGLVREEAVAATLADVGPTLFQGAVILALGALALWGGELSLVSGMGQVLSLLVVATLLGNLCGVPALLAGPLGRLLEIRIRIEKQRRVTEEELALAPLRFSAMQGSESRELATIPGSKVLPEGVAREAS